MTNKKYSTTIEPDESKSIKSVLKNKWDATYQVRLIQPARPISQPQKSVVDFQQSITGSDPDRLVNFE